jgi:hypothetical protein
LPLKRVWPPDLKNFVSRALRLHHAVSPCDGPRIPQFTQRMMAPLAKWMDWSATQIVAMMMPADAFNNNASCAGWRHG